MLQIGMHAGCAGGVDRYVDGLCRAFDRSGEPYRGLVFGRGGDAPDLPLGTTILGPADAPLRVRWRLIRDAVRESRIAPGQTVTSYHAGAGSPFLASPDLERSGFGESATVIASHFALYAWPTLGLRREGFRLISHFHGPWAEESAAEGASRISVIAKRILERHVYHASDHLVSASEAFRQLAIQRYGVRPERIKAVHAGIDAAPTAAATDGLSRREARERLGWPVEPERRIVFCVRRITRRMGLENLLAAVSGLVVAHPDLILMIGGKGPILEELRTQVARQGLENHVRLLGFLPEADLPIAYRAADFTVVPSVSLEGFGLVILESWAAGTPVLVTPVGGMPEVVRPFAADCVLAGSGVEDLVHGMDRVLRGEQRLQEGEACQEYVRRVHDWGAVAQRLLTVYATGGL